MAGALTSRGNWLLAAPRQRDGPCADPATSAGSELSDSIDGAITDYLPVDIEIKSLRRIDPRLSGWTIGPCS